MKSNLVTVVLVCLLAVVGVHGALAQCNLILPSVLYCGPAVSLMICPAGDGDALSQAWLYATPAIPPPTQVDATITAQLLDCYGVPIANYPYEDLLLEFVGTCGCDFGGATVIADHSSDALGFVEFSGPLIGGGSATRVTINLLLSGSICATNASSNLRLNSVDFDCNGVVDSDDEDEMDPLHADEDYSADLNHDGQWTTGDLDILAQHLSSSNPHECR